MEDSDEIEEYLVRNHAGLVVQQSIKLADVFQDKMDRRADKNLCLGHDGDWHMILVAADTTGYSPGRLAGH